MAETLFVEDEDGVLYNLLVFPCVQAHIQDGQKCVYIGRPPRPNAPDPIQNRIGKHIPVTDEQYATVQAYLAALTL